ncbi:hypothetical protein CDAR_72601 [Caerostris darwini]|uniref:Uncharacterized protein n=1 Tax=Caerostris darwini TaxID=1538125 RepID=A0AAV4MM45_9ARAC|nr:hypothetical protein CDAR_72601 [Caerostris darwini]
MKKISPTHVEESVKRRHKPLPEIALPALIALLVASSSGIPSINQKSNAQRIVTTVNRALSIQISRMRPVLEFNERDSNPIQSASPLKWLEEIKNTRDLGIQNYSNNEKL